jgi:integration host factor subunit alpha
LCLLTVTEDDLTLAAEIPGDEMAGKTLTRADLSEAVHRQVGLSRTESADLVKSVLDLMTDTLVLGDTVKLSSFGTFMVRQKSGRLGRNPKTGEEVPITPRRVLVFRPSQVMKNQINGEEEESKG